MTYHVIPSLSEGNLICSRGKKRGVSLFISLPISDIESSTFFIGR